MLIVVETAFFLALHCLNFAPALRLVDEDLWPGRIGIRVHFLTCNYLYICASSHSYPQIALAIGTRKPSLAMMIRHYN